MAPRIEFLLLGHHPLPREEVLQHGAATKRSVSRVRLSGSNSRLGQRDDEFALEAAGGQFGHQLIGDVPGKQHRVFGLDRKQAPFVHNLPSSCAGMARDQSRSGESVTVSHVTVQKQDQPFGILPGEPWNPRPGTVSRRAARGFDNVSKPAQEKGKSS